MSQKACLPSDLVGRTVMDSSIQEGDNKINNRSLWHFQRASLDEIEIEREQELLPTEYRVCQQFAVVCKHQQNAVTNLMNRSPRKPVSTTTSTTLQCLSGVVRSCLAVVVTITLIAAQMSIKVTRRPERKSSGG